MKAETKDVKTEEVEPTTDKKEVEEDGWGDVNEEKDAWNDEEEFKQEETSIQTAAPVTAPKFENSWGKNSRNTDNQSYGRSYENRNYDNNRSYNRDDNRGYRRPDNRRDSYGDNRRNEYDNSRRGRDDYDNDRRQGYNTRNEYDNHRRSRDGYNRYDNERPSYRDSYSQGGWGERRRNYENNRNYSGRPDYDNDRKYGDRNQRSNYGYQREGDNEQRGYSGYNRRNEDSYDRRNTWNNKRSYEPSFDDEKGGFNKRIKKDIPLNPPPSSTLGIFGINISATRDDLTEFVDTNISGIPYDKLNLVTDRNTGDSRGFAFVYFSSINDAMEAKKLLTGKELHNKAIRVDYSITNSDRSKGVEKRSY